MLEVLEETRITEKTCDGPVINSMGILLSEDPKLENPVPEEGTGDRANFMKVPAGPFFAGADCKLVIITDDFWIGKYPVTNADFQNFIIDGGYQDERWWCPTGWESGRTRDQMPVDKNKLSDKTYARCPVTYVNWYEARAYAAWYGVTHNLPPCDIPYEAQWEKAARGTDKRKYPWGDDEPTPEHAAFHPHAKGVEPVDSHPKGVSPYGVYDMSGNVWEWCRDQWHENYPCRPVNPFFPPTGLDTRRGFERGIITIPEKKIIVVDPDILPVAPKHRGRPKGSKNKPKTSAE
jgi:hypothetical protein